MKATGSRVGKAWRVQVAVVRKGFAGCGVRCGRRGVVVWVLSCEMLSWRMGSVGVEVRWASAWVWERVALGSVVVVVVRLRVAVRRGRLWEGLKPLKRCLAGMAARLDAMVGGCGW